jgi:hypothetical protein
MRPRFSIRTLLILTALAAASCYWWIARPTIVAERFVAALALDDQTTLESLWIDAEIEDFRLAYLYGPIGKNSLELTLAPRTWQDIWRGQRSIELVGKGGFAERATMVGSKLIATSAGVEQLPGSRWSVR